MNLYLLSQDKNYDYDTYDSAATTAESEEEALKIHPNGEEMVEGYVGYTWVPKEFVKIKKIGVAEEGTISGVICASFNAG